ncbi:hypothetical protein A6A08_25100 [Nocardiopsis sp. TSRI0078]|uniref:hypothetical protein n=1 Tax=unclassified Nocardiopsis TaxID=2649073 RepID=UPI000938D828|nr:hypothetical protein [Nocardiopsis sp. TSRI0078]OKI17958.1 hypothetical protein A6A08_25100 [Nocardiopsis sp. TSRI0078]
MPRAVDEGSAHELMSVAEPAFSARLAALTDQAPPRYPLAERHAHLNELAARLRPALPRITDERLLAGGAGMVWTAVECRERLTCPARA